jgi:hypothetical protein
VFERRLEVAVAVARSKQDRDVGCARVAAHAAGAIAHRRAREQPHDFVGDPVGGLAHGCGGDELHRRIVDGWPLVRWSLGQSLRASAL